MRIDKKKRKESRNNTLTPPFPKIDLIMDHTLKIFGQLCLMKKKRLGWTDYDFWWWFQFMCNVPYAFNHCLCVCECVTLTCVRQDLAWCIKDYIMIFWCTLVSSIITYYNKKKCLYIKSCVDFFVKKVGLTRKLYLYGRWIHIKRVRWSCHYETNVI